MSIYISLLFISLFLLVQKNTVVSLKLNWLVYTSLVVTFVEGIICIWILKLIIEAGYEHKIYLTYILYRLLSLLGIMLVVAVISVQHLMRQPEDISSTKKDILKYYLIFSLTGMGLIITYLLFTSVVYSLHMSVVKEFYKIVALIVEAQSQYQKNKQDIEIVQGIPEVCIGVPLYEQHALPKDLKEDSLNLSLQDAKFEVEIELAGEDGLGRQQSLSKIKVFQCESDSSESDSYRINVKTCSDPKNKKQSCKIPKGRRLTVEEDDHYGINRRISEQSNLHSSTKQMAKISDEPIDEEEDEDRFGLDFLEDYHNTMKVNTDKNTAFTSDGEMVASPVSKLSLRKKVSVKNVTRRQSFSSNKHIKLRKFTINEDPAQQVK